VFVSVFDVGDLLEAGRGLRGTGLSLNRFGCHETDLDNDNEIEDSTNFPSLALFKRSLNSNIIVRHCKIYYF